MFESLALPDSADPYPAFVQGSLALSLEPVRDEPQHLSTLPATDSAAEKWIRRYLHAAAQIAHAHRPYTQLVRWTRPDVLARLRKRAEAVAQAGRTVAGVTRGPAPLPRVRSVHVQPVIDSQGEATAFEATLILTLPGTPRTPTRSEVVAARFESHRGRLMCTVLDFGP